MTQTQHENQTVVALVMNADGTVYDSCYNWESGQSYALDGWIVRATAPDGRKTKKAAQALYDAEKARHDDCFGPRPEYVRTTPNGTLVSVAVPSAAAVSAVLRKAGFVKSVMKKSASVRTAIPTPGYHVQQRKDHVRVGSTFSGTPIERYETALTNAGYVTEREDIGRIIRVYKAA